MVVNSFLRKGVVHLHLKEVTDLPILNNFHPVSNLPFLERLIEKVVTQQCQSTLDETDYLGPFWVSGLAMG